MKKIILCIIIPIYLYPLFIYPQNIQIDAFEFIKEYYKNNLRTDKTGESYVGNNIQLNGILLDFGNKKGETVLLISSDEGGFNAVACVVKINDKDFILKLSREDNISISGKLKKYGALDYLAYVGVNHKCGFWIDAESIVENGVTIFESIRNERENSNNSDYSIYVTGNQLAEAHALGNINNYLGKVIKFSGKILYGGNDFFIFEHTAYTGSGVAKNITSIRILGQFEEYLNSEQTDITLYGKDITLIGTFEKGEPYSFFDIAGNPKYSDYIIKNARLSKITENDKKTTFTKDYKNRQEKAQKDEINFETFLDLKDSVQYKFIKIGNLYWMAENYKYPSKGSNCYDNNTKCEKYGRLYDVESAIKNSPTNWRLPSKKDWDDLINYFGGQQAAYNKFLSGGRSGLNLTLGGVVTPNGDYQDVGTNGFYWTSDKNYGLLSSKPIYMIINSAENKIYFNSFDDMKANVRYVINAY